MNLIRRRRNWISAATTPAPRRWELDLGDGHQLALHGRIDRVDLWREPGGDTALALVMDYKSGGKKLDAILVEHGVQLQLLAYLNVLRHWADPRSVLGVARLVPAGVFYVNLRGQYESGNTRAEVLDDAGDARKRAYRHTGRFDASVLPKLDRARSGGSIQLSPEPGRFVAQRFGRGPAARGI